MLTHVKVELKFGTVNGQGTGHQTHLARKGGQSVVSHISGKVLSQEPTLSVRTLC